MFELFIGLPEDFLLNAYVKSQGNFSHVVRLVNEDRIHQPTGFSTITENVYPLEKLEKVSTHYKRSILHTLLLIEVPSLRSLLKNYGALLQALSERTHLVVWIWISKVSRVAETLASYPDFMSVLNNVYYMDVGSLLDVLPCFGSQNIPSLEIGEEINLVNKSNARKGKGEGKDKVGPLDPSRSNAFAFYELNLPERRLRRIPPPTPVARAQIKTYRTLMRI